MLPSRAAPCRFQASCPGKGALFAEQVSPGCHSPLLSLYRLKAITFNQEIFRRNYPKKVATMDDTPLKYCRTA
ncbi:hypothetical protein AAMO2058_001407600 [Amorphochlora amoebiformis]